MVTVGFGDISPVNDREILLCIITMLIACGVFVIIKYSIILYLKSN